MTELLLLAAIFALSFVVGYLLILRVPPLLHTPLMSMTNAISGVTVLGALLLFAVATSATHRVLGATAIALAAFNVVGGFAVTERMLKLFRAKRQPTDAQDPPDGPADADPPAAGASSHPSGK